MVTEDPVDFDCDESNLKPNVRERSGGRYHVHLLLFVVTPYMCVQAGLNNRSDYLHVSVPVVIIWHAQLQQIRAESSFHFDQ